MTDSPAGPSGSAPLDHPALARALAELARALDRRAVDDERGPSYLELAVMVVDVDGHLDDLSRLLVHCARRHDGTTWKQIAQTFGISRPTAYKRFGDPSPNDVTVTEKGTQ